MLTFNDIYIELDLMLKDIQYFQYVRGAMGEVIFANT